MIFYRFHQSDGEVAITSDITGLNLPKRERAWRADGRTEISSGDRPRLKTESAEIIETIARDGFFLGSSKP